MIYPIKLFIDGTQKLSFNISSENVPYKILEDLNTILTSAFKSKIKYLSKVSCDINFVKQEINYLRLMNKNQNNLIVCYLLSHYLNNDKKAFDIYLTCNDFKIKSDINITDFLRKNPSKVC